MSAATSPGLVCAHHHLYSSLARGMPAPPGPAATTFRSILESIWWRLDAALDLEMIEWAAKLGALEALECGTTAIVDHHESPSAIEGSLSVIARACDEVGVRVVVAYGVTDRWGDDATLWSSAEPPPAMTDAARRGLVECERAIAAGHSAMVGIHAAFTCSDATLEAAAGLARDRCVGVHVHVAEGPEDADAGRRLAALTTNDWLLAHCVGLAEPLAGTVVHNPRSNMNNGVGYARPVRFSNSNRVALGTDGIGGDMLEEFRLAYARHREQDRTASPETAWRWLTTGHELVPAAARDVVTWSYEPIDAWHLAFTTGVRALDVVVDGEHVLRDGQPTRVDRAEIRAKAREQALRLFRNLK